VLGKAAREQLHAVLKLVIDLRRQPVRREVAPKRGRLSVFGCDFLGVKLEALRLECACRAHYHVK
jgi:hypothetical protein